MRKPIIAGNWKMNKTPSEAAQLLKELKPILKDAKCDVVVCPTFVCLGLAAEELKDSNIAFGAQNVHWADKGAFTAEISPVMLKEIGAEYAIIGHSERRQYFGETDEAVNQRVKAALSHGITPIICVGETLAEREDDVTESVIKEQVVRAFEGVENPADTVIAYEPVWAIGTGKTATPEQADEVCGFIRALIGELYGAEGAEAVRIQYGGSMNAKNAAVLMSMPNIDGGLIGSASLNAEDFAKIVYYDREG